MRTRIIKVLIASTILFSSCSSADKSESGQKLAEFLDNEKKTRTSSGQPYFETFEMGQCVENCKDPDKLFRKEYSDQTLELKCGVWLNCMDRWVYPKIIADTLFIDFNVNDSIVTACDCYFNFEGTLKNIPTDPKVIIVGGHKFGG